MSKPVTVQQDKGNFFWRLSKKFQFAADKLIPDSFVFCVILALLTFILGMVFTRTNPLLMVKYWYDGFWTQSTFAFQMTIMVVVCAAFAKAPIIGKALDRLATVANTPRGSMLVLMLFGFISSFVNWAFCAIVTPILAMRMAKNVKGLHFPMMIASGYTTMILGQCLSPSSSLYALVASDGHFMVEQIGVLTQAQTTYNPMNIILWVILAAVIMLVSILTTPPASEVIEFHGNMAGTDLIEEDIVNPTPADRMNGSRLLMMIVGLIGIVYAIYSFVTNGFLASLSLNFMIFLFITANAIVYNTPKKFIAAIRDSMTLATDVMIQFPFYGAIMGMMTASGLGEMLVTAMSGITTANTVPAFTFFSAWILNLFIPSQGGQWIVQGVLS